MYIDEHASEAQFNALVSAHRGERGGPLADIVKLIGEMVSMERAVIEYSVVDGMGRMKVGETIEAELELIAVQRESQRNWSTAFFSTITRIARLRRPSELVSAATSGAQS